jgi:hypothetical protein
MRGMLVLAVLSAKSRYSREIEIAVEDSDGIPDALQAKALSSWGRLGACGYWINDEKSRPARLSMML